MHRSYQNPPITEALVELRFEGSRAWSMELAEALRAELGAAYAGPRKLLKHVHADLALELGEEQKADVAVQQGLARVMFSDESGTRLIGVASDQLTVHMLAPYHCDGPASGWVEFRERIDGALEAYDTVASPGGVAGVSVRYINQIQIPRASVEIGEYVRCAPMSVGGLPERIGSFVSRTEYVYDDGARMHVMLASLDAPPQHVGLLLDIEVGRQMSEVCSLEGATSVVEELRDRERAAFEALITDQARELFDAN